MGEKNEKVSFWATLPGCLTGIAAMITAVATCIGVLYTAGIIKIPATPIPLPSTTTENFTQNSIPTATLPSTPIIDTNTDPTLLLPDAKDINAGYEVQEQSYTTNEDIAKQYDDPSQIFINLNEWGRVKGYYIEYVNTEGCSLKSGYPGFTFNTVLYMSSSGAEQALDWLSQESQKDTSYTDQAASARVGDKANITWYEYKDDCEPARSIRAVELDFQKYNSLGVVHINVIKGSVSDAELLDQAIWFAKLIELKMVAEASR